MLSARPKIAELVFQCYGRSIHPELFVTHQSRTLQRKRYNVILRITSTGHVVAWEQPNGLMFTEVATSAGHELPLKRRLMSHRLRGEHHDCIDTPSGLHYDTQFSIEPIDTQAIQQYQRDLRLIGAKHGLLHQFGSNGRLGENAFSYLHYQSRNDSLHIQAIHTFPDNGVILKSETTFLLPPESES